LCNDRSIPAGRLLEENSMTETERLLIEQACARVVVQFSNFNDMRDYEALCSLFTEDAAFARPTDPGNYLNGRDHILAAFKARPNDRITRHLISNIVIDVVDGSHAKGACYATLFMALADAEPAMFGVKASASQLIGEFDMDFRLTRDGWKIARQGGRIIFTT
jgi:ketosteroid isomerase-like protein